jgi:hypothetical protein
VEDEKPDGPGEGAVLPFAEPAEPAVTAAELPEIGPPAVPAAAAPEIEPPAVPMPQPAPPAVTVLQTALSDVMIPGPPAAVTPERPAAASPARDNSPAPRVERSRGPRPNMVELREPLYREAGGYRLRLDPPDLARLRELPGSKEKTDRELGELFFDAHSERLTGAVADDVPAPAELRVVVDPFSRQAFLALGKTIRGIVSF